ncbi:restriction endonuclease subunit S [Vibrio parahaemolyticus]|nr:restriction endonuclease subunit S [Vibrio parahaemolyticus]HAS6963978.1 restriction endonuclease subunit S [Vibrio parahaemolyticus]HAS6967450.1 restriction endonuclease subunit S [Vibrio parahaemolyticus]
MSMATEGKVNLGPYPQYPKSVKPGIPKLPASKFGWKKVAIGELFDVVVRPVDMRDETRYRLITVKRSRGGVAEREILPGKKISVKSQFYVEEGDFLISKRQIVHGACGFVPKELDGSIVSNEYAILNCRDIILPEFLHFLTHTPYFQQTCFHSSIGVHVEKMIFKLDDWFKWQIYIPSLEEQQKVATFLNSVDEKLKQLRAKRELITRYKRGLIQKLFSQEIRFKQDDGSDFPDWDEKELKDIAARMKTKNSDDLISRVLTNSATQGVVNQQDYFDKDIANANNLAGYYVVEEGDYVYNPRISVHAPVGPINKNKIGNGLMSPLYTIFRFKSDNTDFYEQYFKTSLWHRYMCSIANYGARHDRMNISIADFMSMPLPCPHADEQDKIVGFLNGIDKKIESIAQQIDSLDTFKKGLLQKIFV